MLTKNELKYYSSLLIKKFRDKENKFLCEGIKIVEDALNSSLTCEVLIASREFVNQNSEFERYAHSKNIRFEVLKNTEFNRLSDTKNPQGIVGIFNKSKEFSKSRFFETLGLKVCLENISDPGNIGTILRNCDWFGIKDIIVSNDSADIYNPKTIRASMGSLFHLNILEEVNLKEFLPTLKEKGYKIYCSDLNGENIYNHTTDKKSVVIFSNEANGPSKEILNAADTIITIPKLGSAESLNVASASAVILSILTK